MSTPTDSGEVHVVVGEAGEPLRAFEDREDAQALVDEWKDGPAMIRGGVRTVDFVRGSEGEAQ